MGVYIIYNVYSVCENLLQRVVGVSGGGMRGMFYEILIKQDREGPLNIADNTAYLMQCNKHKINN